MADAKFTPAPWDCTGCLFPDDDLGGVYYRVQADGMDARGANARLIAAAPELYEALEKALRGFVGTPETRAELHAVLAKARGQ